MTVPLPNIHPNYQRLARFLILTKADYEPIENDVQINWNEIDPSLRNFTPVTDAHLHDQIDFFDINSNFKIKNAARKYKVIPARTQVSETLIFRKALQRASYTSNVNKQDFVLFALPQIRLTPHFEAKLAAIVEYINRPEFKHIDCVILDYCYLSTEQNLVSLLHHSTNSINIDANSQQLYGTKVIQNTKIFTDSIRTFTVDLESYGQALELNKTNHNHTNSSHTEIANTNVVTTQPTDITNNKLEFTVVTPMKMGITFSHCFLIRQSRITKILKQTRPNWLFSDIKRYIPIARTLIVTPGIVHNPYPIYNLNNSREDILELNRRRIKHLQNIDHYRYHMHKLLPFLHTSIASKCEIVRKFSSAIQKGLFIDF